MDSTVSLSISRHSTAAGLSIAAVLLYSLYPVAFGFVETENPYLFAAAWRIGVLLGYAVFLVTCYSDLLGEVSVRQLVWRRTLSWAMLWSAVGFFNTALYAWSISIVDVAVTAVLAEVWPIMLVVLMGSIFRKERRYLKVSPFTLFFFVLAIIGVVCVITSQVGGLERLGDLSDDSPANLTLGVSLALGASAMTALSAFGFKWGSDLARELPSRRRHNRDSLEMFGVVVGSLVACVLSIPVMAVFGVVRGEVVEAGNFALGMTVAPLLGTLPTILWRRANLLSANLGFNVLMHATPFISVCWLLALSLVGAIDLTLLIFGAVVIVAANVGVYIEDRQAQRPPGTGSSAKAIIAGGESNTVEFKVSLRTNLHTYRTEKRLEFVILKTLAAFMNSVGGVLVIGVGDEQQPVGIQVDGFENEDKMNLHLRNIVSARMGSTIMSQVHTSFEDYEGVRVMVVRCDYAQEPVYVRSQQNVEEFFIRAGPTSTRLSLRETVDYVSSRFR